MPFTSLCRLASVARYVGETGKNIEKIFTEAEGLVCSLEHRGWNQLLSSCYWQ